MKKHLMFVILLGMFFSCQQTPLQWTENKDERLFNTRWYNADSSDLWYFDSITCGNKRLDNEIRSTLGPYSMTMEWESFKNCSLAIHVRYNYYTPGEPITYHYYHKSYQYSLSDSSDDSTLLVNDEKYFYTGPLHD